MAEHMVEPPRMVRRLEVITGAGGLRRWSAAEKARITEEAVAPGAVVSEIARGHGMSPQHLFTWRRLANSWRASSRGGTTRRSRPGSTPGRARVGTPALCSSARRAAEAHRPRNPSARSPLLAWRKSSPRHGISSARTTECPSSQKQQPLLLRDLCAVASCARSMVFLAVIWGTERPARPFIALIRPAAGRSAFPRAELGHASGRNGRE